MGKTDRVYASLMPPGAVLCIKGYCDEKSCSWRSVDVVLCHYYR